MIGQPNIAFAQGPPRTEPVTGIFTASPVNAKQRTCTSFDGAYLEIRGEFNGVITSSHPNLTGNLIFMAEPALVNLTTGFGTFRGRFRIVDPLTNQLRTQGEFLSVTTEASLNHSFAVGTVVNRGGSPDSLFATFTSTFDASLNVTGQFGGAGDPRTPAVVQGGHCTGPFTQVP
jgi:hypothetical protein